MLPLTTLALRVNNRTCVDNNKDRFVINSDVGIFQKEVSECGRQEADYALTTLLFVTNYSGKVNGYNEEKKKASNYETLAGGRTMTGPYRPILYGVVGWAGFRKVLLFSG